MKREVHVLVTGFDEFGGYGANPSFLIASSLPSAIATTNGPRIILHVRNKPVEVSYASVREHIPGLLFDERPIHCNHQIDEKTTGGTTRDPYDEGTHDGQQLKEKLLPNYDFVLHLGLAAGRVYYTMETIAHRDGYFKPDVRGVNFYRDHFWKDMGAPRKLKTDLQKKPILKKWKEECKNVDVRLSSNAGRYLCEFIFYTSLYEFWKHKATQNVAFIHVPSGTSADDIDRGRKVVEGFLKAVFAIDDVHPSGSQGAEQSLKSKTSNGFKAALKEKLTCF